MRKQQEEAMTKVYEGGGGLKAVGRCAHTLQGKSSAMDVHRRFNDPREPRSALLAGTIGEDSAGLAPARPCNGLVIVGLECKALSRDRSMSSLPAFGLMAAVQSGARRFSGAKSPAQGLSPPKNKGKRKQRKQHHMHVRCSCQSNRNGAMVLLQDSGEPGRFQMPPAVSDESLAKNPHPALTWRPRYSPTD